MVSNQGLSDERLQPRTKGMRTVKEADMIVAKLDLLMKHLNERAKFKKHRQNYAQAMSSHLTAKSVAMMDTRGMTASRPVKMQPTSTTTTTGPVHKEAKGGVKHAHHSKEGVTISTQILIQISIQTNLLERSCLWPS